VSGPGAVMGAFGYDLLAPVKYWTLVKKLSLLAAVDAGTLAFDQVRVAHALTEEEIDSWRRLYERHGAAGLRATKLQAYRDLDGGGSA